MLASGGRARLADATPARGAEEQRDGCEAREAAHAPIPPSVGLAAHPLRAPGLRVRADLARGMLSYHPMNPLCHATRLRIHLRNLAVVAGAAGMLSVGLQACGGSVAEEGTVLTSETGATCVLGAHDGEPGTYCSITSWYVAAKGEGCATLSCNAICGESGSITCGYDKAKERFGCSWYCVVDGRRHGLAVLPPETVPANLGEHFARMAYNEALAVQAFTCLRDELRALGAPRALLAACGRAIDDERKHVRMANAMARRFGAFPLPPPASAPPTRRSALEIAKENGREGCGRELLGVFVGEWHAAHAEDAAVRRFYARISRDEARHAAFSVRLQRWLRGRLNPAARAAVDAEALAFLGRAVVHAPTSLGQPGGAVLEAVVRRLASDLDVAWAA